MTLFDILGGALKLGALVNPALAPIATAEQEAAPLLSELFKVLSTPEGQKTAADVEAVLVKHGTSSHQITQSVDSARGRLVSERDQVMIDKTAGA
jgi:hypothetical protein